VVIIRVAEGCGEGGAGSTSRGGSLTEQAVNNHAQNIAHPIQRFKQRMGKLYPLTSSQMANLLPLFSGMGYHV